MDTPQAPRKDPTDTYKAMAKKELAACYQVRTRVFSDYVQLLPKVQTHRGKYSPAQVAYIVQELGHWNEEHIFRK